MKTITTVLICLLFLCSMTSKTQNAPVTMAGVVLDHGPTVIVPVKVTGFVDIGSISLTMDYNITIVQITGVSPNVNLPGFTADWTTVPGRIAMGWFGLSGVTLPDYSTLVNITFSGLNAGETDLTWINNGGLCEYAKFDGGAYNALTDTPTVDFYKNGHIKYQPNGPVTIAGTVLSHGPTVVVPLEVTGFVDIGSISLTLDYNIGIVQVLSISPNVNLPGFTADWTTNPGRIVMGWYGSSGVTLSDYSHIADITFTGLSTGSTPLTWINNGGSCEYSKFDGGAYTTLNDLPTGTFYKNGRITYQRSGPITVAPVYTSAPSPSICIPIKVYQFTNIGSFSLTLDYDPLILTFQSVSSTTIPGTWSLSGQATVPGRLIVGGFGPGIPSLPDGSELFNACFSYIGGTSTLKWYDANGISCEYTDATSLDPLYDLPQSTYYIDGVVTAPLIADFKASNVIPPRNSTVTFTDLSTGSPTSWDWSFDRTTFIYMPGSDSHSQNPQVQFTQGGPYTVTLTVHNAYLTDTKVKIAYIWVGIPGLWTGVTSTDWYTTTNWDDWRVPTALTDVLIPPAPVPNWPVYIGNFTIGTQCKTITLGDITSQMTITGNIIIP